MEQYNVIMICVVRARFSGIRVAVLSVLVESRRHLDLHFHYHTVGVSVPHVSRRNRGKCHSARQAGARLKDFHIDSITNCSPDVVIRNSSTFIYLSIDRSISLSCERKAWSPLWFQILPLSSICGSIDRSVLWKKAWSTLWFEILPLLSVYGWIDRSICLVKESLVNVVIRNPPTFICLWIDRSIFLVKVSLVNVVIRNPPTVIYLWIDRSIDLFVLWKKSLVNVVIRNPPTFIYRSIDLFCQRKPGQRCDSKSSHFYQSFDRSV